MIALGAPQKPSQHGQPPRLHPYRPPSDMLSGAILGALRGMCWLGTIPATDSYY